MIVKLAGPSSLVAGVGSVLTKTVAKDTANVAAKAVPAIKKFVPVPPGGGQQAWIAAQKAAGKL